MSSLRFEVGLIHAVFVKRTALRSVGQATAWRSFIPPLLFFVTGFLDKKRRHSSFLLSPRFLLGRCRVILRYSAAGKSWETLSPCTRDRHFLLEWNLRHGRIAPLDASSPENGIRRRASISSLFSVYPQEYPPLFVFLSGLVAVEKSRP